MAFDVTLPAGGRIGLQSADECDLWKRSASKYMSDYHLQKLNDLVLLGAILQQQVILYRAQRAMNGEKPDFDPSGAPTGTYTRVGIDPEEMNAAMSLLNRASGEIMRIEKALGISKVQREAGGSQNIADYLTNLKRAAHARGLHVSKRVLAYEEVIGEARWRVRILRNGDAEDRAYHGLTPDGVIDWLDEQLHMLEQIDKDFAREKGKLYVGKL